MADELTWHRVGKSEEIRDNEPKQFQAGGVVVAVFRVDDDFFAIDDICTHQFAFLSDGCQEGDVVECPLHQARFHIPTGKCLGPPAECDTRSFPVRVENGEVFVGLPPEQPR